ncbi:ATP-binding protein [Zeaxanthinibacter enoshimensis]|uniref:tetratricopeptide repeat-containing sensor histidine kinase n=1 Tax=Zeaxanthinibacter enoshimensis TaxID=392009 RepID=UPI00356527CC
MFKSTSFKRLVRFCMLLLPVVALAVNALVNEREELKRKIKQLQANSAEYQKDSLYIDLLLNLGKEIRYYNSDSLYILAKDALAYSRKINYRKGESYSFMRIADYYSDKGDNKMAVTFYRKSLNVANEIGNTGIALQTMNNLASEYGYIGDYSKALSGYLDGIELATKVNDLEMLSIMNENIANLYASQNDYSQSLEFFKKVSKLNEEIGNEVYSAQTNSNLASVYAEMGEQEYAMFHINKAIAVFERRNLTDWLAFAYEIKGKVYLQQENFKWALYWYHQSELLHQKIQDDRGIIDLYNGMAEAHLGTGNDSISEQYAQNAFAISTRIQFTEGTQKCAKTLYKIHKNKENYSEALRYHELFQRLSDTLSRNENSKILSMLKTKNEYDKQKLALIEDNKRELAKQQSYVNIALFVLLIFIVVTYLVHRGQKIQKQLNLELKSKQESLKLREAELEENISTKNKLFSIIGHDLRGPIGALQSLLNMFKDGEIGKDDFWDFIPKLRDDVDHISFTLNNLLQWGYTQMNGAVTKPTVVAIDSLVDENINLLSELAETKKITINNEIPENTLVYADTNQIDIVVRNLLSNALKFTPDNGIIQLKVEEHPKHFEFSVRDTGVGMDKITQEKLFSKDANVSTYGTNNEKGTGLGLSLCKEMVEKNNGTIWVESALRIGTSFYFTIPKYEKAYSNAS